MDASVERLKFLVDVCDDAPILFLAHNGPSGLGDRANSIWGCDFREKEEDWGDRDLDGDLDIVAASLLSEEIIASLAAVDTSSVVMLVQQQPGQLQP